MKDVAVNAAWAQMTAERADLVAEEALVAGWLEERKGVDVVHWCEQLRHPICW